MNQLVMDEKEKSQPRKKVNPNSFLFSSLLFFHLGLLSTAYAAPEGGQVVGGSGSINQSGLNTTISQATQNMAIDWQSYNVQQNERVQYIQPNSRSISLNRILGNNASTILGRIDANGQVILVNPNGIFFSPTSVINVGGIMASGLDIKPSDFMNGNYIFNEVANTDGFVFNSGIINAATGGSVTLLGKQVKNDGMIVARLGAVNLAAGKAAVVTFDNAGLLGIKITQEVLQNELGIDPAVLNSGSINAEGGRILLTGSVSQDIFSSAVNTGNIEQATSAVVHADGTFTLGGGADVVNTGTLDVSTNNVNQHAGNIVVIGENVTSSGTIKADNLNGLGGNIELHATDTTMLTKNSETTARANINGQGGTIKVLGNNVGLFDNAQVDASGANGGGEVLIGGDKTGANKQIRNAEFIYLGENTKVKADATDNGNGGKLITFASDTAKIYGNLSVRGGANGGNGGFIETSGLKGFEILKTPDIAAPQGQGGTWLIDPYNIEIVAGGGSSNIGTSTNTFTSTGGTAATPASIGVDLLYTALDNDDAVVTITTGNTPSTTDVGDINFETDFDYDRGGRRSTLVLNAANDINTLGKNIVASNRSINLVFNANADNNAAGGNVNITNSEINTNGGNFTATGVDFTLTETGSGQNIKTQGGNVWLDMTGIVTLDGDITTEGGTVTIVNSASMNTGKLLNTRGQIDTRNGTTGNGVVSINSIGLVDIGTDIFTRGSDVVVTSNGFTTQAGADINTTGNTFTVGTRTDGNILINSGAGALSIGARLFTNSGGNANNGRVDLISTTGAITLGDSVTTSGGKVTIQGVSFDNTSGSIQTQAGTQGDVAITTTGQVNLNGAINTDDGSVIVNAGTTYNSVASGTIATNNNGGGSNGTVSINAQGNVTSVGQINTNNATVNFNNDASITTGGVVAVNGNITTNGGSVTVDKSTSYNSTGDIDSGAVAINSTGTITSGGRISSNGGSVDLTSIGGSPTVNQINLNNSLVSNGGVVSISGGSFNSNNSGSINSGSGNTAITTAGNINTNAQITATNGNVNLTTTAIGSNVTLNRGLSTNTNLTVNTQGGITATNAPLLIGGTTTLTSIGNITLDNGSNNFQGNVALNNAAGNISITDSNNISFATSNIGTGTFSVNATGIAQAGGEIIQSAGGGNVILNSGSSNLTLNNTANEFTGAVAITTTGTANATLNDVSDIRLGNVSTGGNLTLLAGTVATNSGNIVFANTNVGGVLTATAGTSSNITQSNAISVTGNAVFNVEGGRDITLGHAGNNFSSGISFNAKANTSRLRNVTITNANSLNLQTLDLSGNLTVTASGISNSAGSMVVDGNTLLDARGNDIDLTLGTNNFTNVVIANARDVRIINGTDLNIGDGAGSVSSISGDLNLTARTGDITQTAALTMGSTTLATFNADTGNINLSTHRDNGTVINNNFTNIVLNAAGNVNVADVNGINLGDALGQPTAPSSIGGNLTVNANTVITNTGNITQTADLTMSANTTADFTAGNGRIILDSSNNNFETIALSSNNAVTVNDSSGIILGTTTASALTVNAGGNITDSGNIAVTGLTTLAVSGTNDILLNTNSHNLKDVVFTGNNVAINNASDINIGDSTLTTTPNSTANGNLTIIANGNITDIGSAKVNVTNVGSSAELIANAGDINLENTDFKGSLKATAANSIAINDATGLILNQITAANNIDLTAGDNINGGRLTAARVDLQANTGINTTTQTAILKADNVTGTVNIKNTGNVILESLTTSGDITFSNDSNINMAAGSVNADYDVGNLTMTTAKGSFLGLGTGDINNADITAFTAKFSGKEGSFGSVARPLYLNVKEQVIITTRQSIAPRLTPPGPRLGVTDFSLFQFNFFDASNAVAGEQLITLEELEDIDPAIFSDVRNYTYGQIAIRLPRDQLFEDELDNVEQE